MHGMRVVAWRADAWRRREGASAGTRRHDASPVNYDALTSFEPICYLTRNGQAPLRHGQRGLHVKSGAVDVTVEAEFEW